jgi:hypothetical protein
MNGLTGPCLHRFIAFQYSRHETLTSKDWAGMKLVILKPLVFPFISLSLVLEHDGVE